MDPIRAGRGVDDGHTQEFEGYVCQAGEGPGSLQFVEEVSIGDAVAKALEPVAGLFGYSIVDDGGVWGRLPKRDVHLRGD